MNNQKAVLAVIVLAIIGVGIYFLQSNKKPAEMRNAEMLSTEGGNDINTTNVSYFEDRNGYLAKPAASGNYPGVVMIHENRGINDFVRQMADQLAKQGFVVLAVDLFGRSLGPDEDARAVTANFNQETGVANMRAAAGFLRAQGVKKIASLGWCFGGRQSVALAISGEPLDATVVYYGGGMATSVDQLKPIKWPVLGIFGDKDTAIPVEMVRTFEASLNSLGVENEIHIYPGVGHAFANPSGMNYAANETKDAWAKTLAFLNKNLK